MHGVACIRPRIVLNPGFRPATCSRHAVIAVKRRSPLCQAGSGKDVVDGWLDLAKLVTSAGNSNKTAFDELASSIGKDVYVDVGGWHLYLRDLNAAPALKMSQALATKLGPQAAERLRESDIEAILKQIPVKLGAGKTTVSLLDIMPSSNVRDLTRIVEDYGRNRK